MNILAVDTTSKKASIALLISKENKMFEKHIDNEITHSEKLMPLIDSSLIESNIKLKDIDLFSCVLGPGSFTGIRIGISTIKAFAKVFNKKIFGIDSLELLAYNVDIDNIDDNEIILSILNSRSGRVYYNLYKKVSKTNITYLKPLINTSNSNIDEMLEHLKKILDSKENKISIVFSSFEKDSEDVRNISNQLKINIKEIIFSKDNISLILKLIPKLKENKKLFNNYLYDYLSLDAIYVNKSSAERIQNAKQNGNKRI